MDLGEDIVAVVRRARALGWCVGRWMAFSRARFEAAGNVECSLRPRYVFLLIRDATYLRQAYVERSAGR